MATSFTPKIVTANDLLDGDVIYMTEAGAWTRVMAAAHLFRDPCDAEKALDEALQQPAIAVGPYLADARAGRRGTEPAHFREGFRARGPSNYAHGKQAGQAGVHL